MMVMGIRMLYSIICYLSFIALSSFVFPGSAAAIPQDYVVRIVATANGKKARGSGVIVSYDARSLKILTASHVVENFSSIELDFPSLRATRNQASLISLEAGNSKGLAILNVPVDESFVSQLGLAPRISGASFNPGDNLLIVGYEGFASGVPPVTTSGVYSRAQGTEFRVGRGVVPGFSGGAVFDADANLAGIIVETSEDVETIVVDAKKLYEYLRANNVSVNLVTGEKSDDLRLTIDAIESTLTAFKEREGSAARSGCRYYLFDTNIGFRYPYCLIRDKLDIGVLSELSGLKIFNSGPHSRVSLNLEHKTKFGHYNPEFVEWLRDTFSKLKENTYFMTMTRPLMKSERMYRLFLNLHAGHEVLMMDNEFHDTQMEYFRTWLDNRGRGSRPYSPRLKTMIGCDDRPKTVSAWRMLPGSTFNVGQSSSLMEDPEDLYSIQMDEFELDVALGFWMRRIVDGTEDPFYDLLISIDGAYDGAITQVGERVTWKMVDGGC